MNEKCVKNIRKELTTYITENNIQALILGISGGIDSALCAVLARPICDFMGIPLVGRSLPIITNKEDELKRARLIGSIFCTDFEEKDLSNFFNIMAITLNFPGEWVSHTGNQTKIGKQVTYEDKIRIGNAKARLRMVYLYDLAKQYKGMVLSTDNWTEYCLGFWTTHGDVGDYGMLQELWKTEVYDLALFLAASMEENKAEALIDCVQAIPTDGLGITNSDLDQLNASSYDEVDKILKKYLGLKKNLEAYVQGTRFFTEDEIKNTKKELNQIEKHPVIIRHIRTHFKRENPYNIPREIICG